MKIIIIIILIFSIISCSDINYNREIVNNGTSFTIDGGSYSYFIPLIIKFQDTAQVYIVPINAITPYLSKFDEYKFYQLKKNLRINNGEIQLNYKNIIYEDFKQSIVYDSPFLDSIKSLSTSKILEKYFIDNFILNTKNISSINKNALIYTLVKRRKFVFVFNGKNAYFENPIFHGKISKNNLKVIDKYEY